MLLRLLTDFGGRRVLRLGCCCSFGDIGARLARVAELGLLVAVVMVENGLVIVTLVPILI